MHSIVNSTIIDFKTAKKVDLKCSHHKKEMIKLCHFLEVLAKAMVVIMLQYKNVQHTVHLKLT